LRWLTEFARPTLRARIYILHPHLHPRPRYETKPSLSTNYYSSIAIRANLHPSIIVRFAFRFTNSLVIRRFGRRFLQIRGNLSRSLSRSRRSGSKGYHWARDKFYLQRYVTYSRRSSLEGRSWTISAISGVDRKKKQRLPRTRGTKVRGNTAAA